jgi:hypothetical protein
VNEEGERKIDHGRVLTDMAEYSAHVVADEDSGDRNP